MYTMFTVKKLSQNDVTTKNKQTNNNHAVADHYMPCAKVYLHTVH